MKVKDVDLGRGTILIHGKGGKIVILPIGFPDLKTDLEVHLVGREPRNTCFIRKRTRRGRWIPGRCTDGSNGP